MNIQKKYLLTYGHNVQLTTIEVWAFNVTQAIEFGEVIRENEAIKSELTKVEQMVPYSEEKRNALQRTKSALGIRSEK